MTTNGFAETTVEAVIFGSYVVISFVVLFIYLRHKAYLDSFVNRLLAVTFGFFLMLCAITHIYSIWYDAMNIILSASCAVVSLIAAACTLYGFRDLDDYLTLRISTSKILRERTIQSLTEGYDLRCCAVGNFFVEGWIKDCDSSFPVEFQGGVQIGNIVQVENRFFRVVSTVQNTVELNATGRQSAMDVELARRKPGCMIYGYDATAEVHMSQEEERMNEMKMAMCMGTAHDVKTPLSSLGIVISSLRSKWDDGDEEYGRLLDEAFVNMEILNLVATQFMEIGTLGTGIKVTPTIDVLDIPTMSDRITKVCSRLRNEHVQSGCHVREGVPSSLLTDVEWVWQIIMNLVTNAAKYTYKGRFDVYVDYQNGLLELRVEDTGIGIDDNMKGGVFDMFVTHQKYGHNSHGIGLHSVKTKVDAFGGSCEILDNPGGGTIFEVKVPAKVDTSAAESKREEQVAADAYRGTHRCLCLVVDDTASIRKMMSHLLREHDVELACNGAEGLDKLMAKEYDIVLSDISMPVMDGTECVRRFRKWEKEHRKTRQQIYSMSANAVGIDSGFDGSLPKPVDSKRLRGLLERVSPPVDAAVSKLGQR
eukprot:g9496.t1